MTMTPTDNPKSNCGESTTIKQTPSECKHYFYNTSGGWTHWCVNLNAPCRLFHDYHCPSYQPKEKKQPLK